MELGLSKHDGSQEQGCDGLDMENEENEENEKNENNEENDGNDEEHAPLRDPHRYISQYADWDVHARMPHGVEDIKRHLKEVDNVPLLVSLYTDSTPTTTRQMLDIFKSYGEVVLAVGSSYRAQNYTSFRSADIAVAISQLPGDKGCLRVHADGSMHDFPEVSGSTLTKSDLCLIFRMVGLEACPLLQTPLTHAGACGTYCDKTHDDTPAPSSASTASTTALPTQREPFREQILFPPELVPAPATAGPQLRMSALLEAVRMGRVLLLNSLQALAFVVLFISALSLWPLVSLAVPVSVPPSLPAPFAIIFLFVYLPILLLINVTAPAPSSVLKNTPRKALLSLDPDTESRYFYYLACRAGYVILSVFITGWLTAASLGDDYDTVTGERSAVAWTATITSFISGYQSEDGDYDALSGMDSAGGTSARGDINSHTYLYKLWLVQDLMATQLLLSLLTQQATLLRRGQGVTILPTLVDAVIYPFLLLYRMITSMKGAIATFVESERLCSGVSLFSLYHWFSCTSLDERGGGDSLGGDRSERERAQGS